MRKAWLLGLVLEVGGGSGGRSLHHLHRLHQPPQPPRVEVIPHDDARRVDVLVDGKPFTAYIYPTATTLRKPTLYPLRTASGKLVIPGRASTWTTRITSACGSPTVT